jgi:hypothetical protein
MVDTAVDLLAKSSPIKPATARLDKRERDAAARFCLKLISMLEPANEEPPAAGSRKKARRSSRARA